MKRHGLRAMIAFRFAFVVLAAVLLISIASNVLIRWQFEKYIEEQQRTQAEELAQNIANQYDGSAGGWNLDYIHGLGMYALNEGYIIKLYDAGETVLWDAEHHDMSLCHQMMDTITLRMQETRPELDGDFVTRRFDLVKNQETVGFLDVSYYSPYYYSENDFQFISALNHILLAVGALSLLGAVLMGLLLAGSIAGPIVKTVEITKQISEGDYNIRFQGDVKAEELYRLAQAVNHMAESLEEQEALRKRLTSDLAHELRTPIANVSSYLEAILEGVWEPTPERLQSCYDELARLSKLVSELEQLRQAESQSLNLRKTEVDLMELAETVLKNFETQFAEKNLHCVLDGTRATAFADRDRLQQVVTNLVSNAVKYSNSSGTVHVRVEDGENAVCLWVEDDGIGIAEEEQKLIFERFYRTDLSRNRKTGGAGIGLAIVKTIVQAHGGEITVESREGHGSRFTVSLPKQPGAEPLSGLQGRFSALHR